MLKYYLAVALDSPVFSLLYLMLYSVATCDGCIFQLSNNLLFSYFPVVGWFSLVLKYYLAVALDSPAFSLLYLMLYLVASCDGCIFQLSNNLLQ